MSIGPKLDRLDFKILAQLQRNGRISNVDLSDAVGLSPSPCLSRVKRLEKAGYITGYGAHIALAKLGSTLTVFTQITLKDHRTQDFSKFEQRARRVDEIVECHLVSGGYDYLCKFIARDVAHYQEVIEGILEGDFGIEKYFSYIVIKTPIVKRYDPIETLFDERFE
jgi:DNA-binding Lrp family transcriptional regulator